MADPKLQAMMAKINSELARPTIPPCPPVGNYPQAPTLQAVMENAPPASQPNPQVNEPPKNMEAYFVQQTGTVLQEKGKGNEGPSKKKVLTVGAITAGATLLVSFVILISTKPRFVVKKTKNEKGVEERKTNVLAIFIISFVLSLIVFIVACVAAFKKTPSP